MYHNRFHTAVFVRIDLYILLFMNVSSVLGITSLKSCMLLKMDGKILKRAKEDLVETNK